MNTPVNMVKCAKYTALDKECNPSRGPTKHQTGLFTQKIPKRGSVLEAYSISGKLPISTIKAVINTGLGELLFFT